MVSPDQFAAYQLQIIAALCQVLLSNESPNPRIQAARLLGEISSNSPIAIATLLQAVEDDPDPTVRTEIVIALGKIYRRISGLDLPAYDKLIDSLNQLNQTLQTMSDQPKVQMNFNAPVTGAAGNVEGDMVINAQQEQNLAAAAKEIQQLLDQLAQTYPHETDRQIEAVKREAKRNPTFRSRLLSAAKAGGVEAVKQVLDYVFKNPVASVVAEAVKAFVEAEP